MQKKITIKNAENICKQYNLQIIYEPFKNFYKTFQFLYFIKNILFDLKKFNNNLKFYYKIMNKNKFQFYLCIY